MNSLILQLGIGFDSYGIEERPRVDMWTWIKSYRLSLVVFFLLAFRPHLLLGVRQYVIRPAEKVLQREPVNAYRNCSLLSDEDDGCGDDGEGCETEDESEYYSDDRSSDGCTDDDDSCAEPADSDVDEPSDGCSDDGSCTAESDASYEYGESDYSDDGCSCTGESVVGSTPVPAPPYYPALSIRLEFSRPHEAELQITDAEHNSVVVLTESRTLFGSGSFRYSWDGILQNGQLAPYGTYRTVLTLDRTRVRSQSFTFSAERGFLVSTDNQMIFEDGGLKISRIRRRNEARRTFASTDQPGPHFQN